MKKTVTLVCAILYSAFALFGQSSAKQESFIKSYSDSNVVSSPCGTGSPGPEWEYYFQKQITAYKQESAKRKQNAVRTIPVIIHLLYDGQTENTIGTKANLHPDQIKAQMDALNDAFAGNATGNSSLPTVFAAVDANDIGITFCLATKDTNGKSMAEPGVERIDWRKQGWKDPRSLPNYAIPNYFNSKIKPKTIWDPTKYLNIWVANLQQFTGHAMFPDASGLQMPHNFTMSEIGTNTTDGIIIASKIFGCQTKYSKGYSYVSQNVPLSKYVQGGLTVHEIGHWLGLIHIWGDSICGNDFCKDTPPQQESNEILCPQHPYKKGYCSGNTTGEMFQNYMGYTQDACMCLFTADQKLRISTAMEKSPYRKYLGTHGLCDAINTGYKLELASDLTVSKNTIAEYEAFDVTANIKNNGGGDYTGDLSAAIYSASSSYVTDLGSSQNKTIAAGNNTGMLTFSTKGYSLADLPLGKYYVQMDYVTNGGGWTQVSNGSYSNRVDFEVVATNNPIALSAQEKDRAIEWMKIYPNPTSKLFTLSFHAPTKGDYQIELSNAIGQIIYSEKVADHQGKYAKQINTESFSKGIYVMKVSSHAGSSVQKVVIE
jgi:hypothetical protein